jgi:rhamnulokinase
MGLWILESCRKEWAERGLDVDYDRLIGEAASTEGVGTLIYPDDPRLFNPPSMLVAIEEQLAESGQRMPTNPAAVARTIFDSLALRYASVVRTIESLTGTTVVGINVVGGGSRNDYLNQTTATASGKPVLAGPVEATVIGTVLVQAVAAGRFASLGEARMHVADNIRRREYTPRRSCAWDDRARRYDAIEAWYMN